MMTLIYFYIRVVFSIEWLHIPPEANGLSRAQTRATILCSTQSPHGSFHS